MSFLNFDPDNTLAGGLYGLSPREVIRLGEELCQAVLFVMVDAVVDIMLESMT